MSLQLHEHALRYQAAGLSVLPARRAEKRPCVGRWKEYQQRLPTSSEVDAWFSNEHDALCLITGRVSGGLEMLDFDQGGELYPAWRELVAQSHQELLDQLVIERSQSGGVHVIWRCAVVEGNLKLASRSVPTPDAGEVELGGKRHKPRRMGDAWVAIAGLIETRGEGGLFLCAPTAGYELLQGDLSTAPVISDEEREILLDAARSLNENTVTHAAPVASSSSDRPGDDYNARGDVAGVLIRHGWTLSQDGENQHWTRPGKRSGTSATLKDRVFYCFSSNAAPFDPGHAYAPFSVFALLEHGGDFRRAAEELGADGYGLDRRSDQGVDLSGIIGEDSEAGSSDPKPAESVGSFPEELLNVPGFIGEVVRHNLATAHRPQPVLALAGAICLQAVLAARKVQDDRGNRTNMYAIGVAQSGGGKEHARKINKNVLFQAGLGNMEGSEDWASDAGLVKVVRAKPAVLFQIDEFGRFLRTIGDPKKAPHLFNVLTVLMKLYSSADTTFQGKAYAGGKDPPPIDQPCAVLYGTTVPEHFFESLTADSLSDGFVARLLLFEAGGIPSRHRTPHAPVPDEILAAARWWGKFEPEGNLQSEHPLPKVVPAEPGAVAVFDQLAALVDDMLKSRKPQAALWARAEEKACRLALVYACSENRETPSISPAAARWACELVTYQTKRMEQLASHWVSDGQFDARQKRVLRIITDAGEIDGRALCRKTQWLSVRDRRDILSNLIETSQIETAAVETDGRTKTMYRPA